MNTKRGHLLKFQYFGNICVIRFTLTNKNRRKNIALNIFSSTTEKIVIEEVIQGENHKC